MERIDVTAGKMSRIFLLSNIQLVFSFRCKSKSHPPPRFENPPTRCENSKTAPVSMFVKVWEVHLKFRLGTKDIDKSHDVFEFRGSVNIVWVGFKRWRNCIFEKDVFRENALSFSGDALSRV